MREQTLRIDKENLKGEVVVGIPSYKERMGLLRDLNLKPNKDGEVEINDDTFGSLEKIYDMAEKYTKKVKVSVVGSEQTLSSVEDLSYYEEGLGIINEDISGVIMNGLKLGKN